MDTLLIKLGLCLFSSEFLCPFQLPMFLRVVKLFLALLNGEINDQVSSSKTNAMKPQDCAIEMPFDESVGQDKEGGTWSGWAWNVGATVGTALLPIYW